MQDNDTAPHDTGHVTGRRRLDPRTDDDWTAGSAGRRRVVERRDAGVRQTRRISSWTAAALVAGVAAGAGYFAHTATTPAGMTSGTSVSGTSTTNGSGTASATGQKPSVTHAVVTSGGSGVTVGGAAGSAGAGASAGAGSAVHWRDN